MSTTSRRIEDSTRSRRGRRRAFAAAGPENRFHAVGHLDGGRLRRDRRAAVAGALPRAGPGGDEPRRAGSRALHRRVLDGEGRGPTRRPCRSSGNQGSIPSGGRAFRGPRRRITMCCRSREGSTCAAETSDCRWRSTRCSRWCSSGCRHSWRRRRGGSAPARKSWRPMRGTCGCSGCVGMRIPWRSSGRIGRIRS